MWWEDKTALLEVCGAIHSNKNTDFKGIYVHCGNSYQPSDTEKARDENIGIILTNS